MGFVLNRNACPKWQLTPSLWQAVRASGHGVLLEDTRALKYNCGCENEHSPYTISVTSPQICIRAHV